MEVACTDHGSRRGRRPSCGSAGRAVNAWRTLPVRLERRNKSGVYRILALDGGIAPAPRRRAAVALRLEEREEISRGIAAGRSIRRIAREPRAVAIDGKPGDQAQRRRQRLPCKRGRCAVPGSGRLRPKACRLAHHARLRWRVAQKLALQWSPEQISGWLKQQFPADQDMQLSHETIYRSLFVQTRGVLKKELMAHLRTARQMRQAKGGTTKSGLGQIVDAVSIRERPAEVEDRAVPGHWEGDLLSGANNTHIATLVERHTRFAMLIKVAEQGHRHRGGRAHQARAQTASGTAPFARPGIAARRWPTTRASPSPPMCRSTSAIRAVPGSAAATKTPTACCASTSRKEPTCRASLRPTSTGSRCA